MRDLILIVEDNQAINLNLECFLEDQKIDSICCFSGEEALIHLQNHPQCNKAIVNMRLPGMSGEKLIADMKLINPSIHVLIHTGALDFTLSEMLLSLGVEQEDVFYKPQKDMSVFLKRFDSKKNS
jgi:DNA-binding NtrC family response regulator